MRNILVTGGAGYIGSHTCKELASSGFQPIVIDNLSFGHRRFVKWGPLVESDIRDTQVVAQAIRDYRAAGIIHFAAFAEVGEFGHAPTKIL